MAPSARSTPGSPRRVLVATDFSKPARLPIQRVASLVLGRQADIEIVHVLPHPLSMADSLLRALAGERMIEAKARLRRALVAAGRPDVTVTARMLRGKPAEQIARQATTGDADLIVLGQRGAGGLRGLVVGSTARGVLHLARRPVLVVGGGPARPYREIVAAVDLSPPSVRALRLASRLSDRPARITIVSAIDDPLRGLPSSMVPTGPVERRRAIRRRLVSRVTSIRKIAGAVGLAPGSWRLALEPGDPRPAILTVANRRDAGLIALGSASTSRLQRALGSVAQWVLERARGDVLIVPRRR